MTRSDNDIYRLFVYSFCDERWKGSENTIFYIYIIYFSISVVNFYFIRLSEGEE